MARTPEIGQGLWRFLSCWARKPEQTTLSHNISILPSTSFLRLRKTTYRCTGVRTHGHRYVRPTLYLLHHIIQQIQYNNNNTIREAVFNLLSFIFIKKNILANKKKCANKFVPVWSHLQFWRRKYHAVYSCHCRCGLFAMLNTFLLSSPISSRSPWRMIMVVWYKTIMCEEVRLL